MSWRSIADAPRDGELLLAWDGKSVRVVYFDANGRWKITRGHAVEMKPTHFIEIPEPPSFSSVEQSGSSAGS